MKNYGGKLLWLGVLVLTALLGACARAPLPDEAIASQANSWKALGGTLDVVTKNNAVLPKALLDRNGKLVVAWAEDNGLWYLRAKRWNGTTWETISFPSKALPFTEIGVNDFDVAFDGSNALVVSERASSGVVTVYKNTGSSWTPLGSGLNTVNLETDQNGSLYGLSSNDTTARYRVKRWNGTVWATVASFRNQPSGCGCFSKVLGFQLGSNGRPILATYELIANGFYTFYGWTGSVWEQLGSSGSTTAATINLQAYAVNASNQVVYAYRYARPSFELDFTAVKSQVQEYSFFEKTSVYDLAFRSNAPTVIHYPDSANYMTVSQWMNGSWTKLGGRLERDSAKIAHRTSLNLLTDAQGKTFVVWAEATCTNSASCGGANIYVSQYVP
jgi:hypothetical protein